MRFGATPKNDSKKARIFLPTCIKGGQSQKARGHKRGPCSSWDRKVKRTARSPFTKGGIVGTREVTWGKTAEHIRQSAWSWKGEGLQHRHVDNLIFSISHCGRTLQGKKASGEGKISYHSGEWGEEWLGDITGYLTRGQGGSQAPRTWEAGAS